MCGKPVDGSLYNDIMNEFKRRMWNTILEQHNNCVANAAKALGINRTHAFGIIKDLGIRKKVRKVGNWDRSLEDIMQQTIVDVYNVRSHGKYS